MSWIIGLTPNQEADPMNLQNILAFILSGDPKIFLLIDESSSRLTEERIIGTFKCRSEAEKYKDDYFDTCKIVEIDIS
jgi:hypothetical protein